MRYSNLNATVVATIAVKAVDAQYTPMFGSGHRWLFVFANGYAASVVKHFGSYGNECDCWEIAVMEKSGEGWALCYDTPVTDDVLGWLEEDAVIETCLEIAAL